MAPFKILNRQTAHHTRAFDVQRVDLELPDGQIQVFDLVLHNNSVSILPLDRHGNIWFVRQYRVGAQAELLELPAGVLAINEDPAEGAMRELREEIGQAAGRLEKLGEAYLAPGYASEKMYFYLATDLRPDPLPQDTDEFLSLVSLPKDEALRLAARGEIQDSKTLAALFLAQGKLR